WAPPLAVLAATVTAMSPASVMVAPCTAAPSMVTTAAGSKFVPLIMKVVPSEQIGLGTIEGIVGAGSFLSEEQPATSTTREPHRVSRRVDERMNGRCCSGHARGDARDHEPVPPARPHA